MEGALLDGVLLRFDNRLMFRCALLTRSSQRRSARLKYQYTFCTDTTCARLMVTSHLPYVRKNQLA
jgi:hypothetical protein